MAVPARTTVRWRIGTLLGIPVYLGRSWVIIAAIITVLFGPIVGDLVPGIAIGAYAVAALFALLLLFSVLLHEAAHAVVAQRQGFTVQRIVADFWGGHTAYHGAQGRPGSAALVAVAGPAANLALALVGWSVLQGVDRGVIWLLLTAFTTANGFVALFNLLPGLPLDGGFLLEALVWKVTGDRSMGTLVAGWVGRGLVVGLVWWGIGLPLATGVDLDLWRVVWVALISTFLWQGASGAVRSGSARRRFERTTVQSVWRPVEQVSGDTPLARPVWSSCEIWLVTNAQGKCVALVDDEALRAVPATSWDITTVWAVAVQQPPGWVIEVDQQDSVITVVTTMQTLQSAVVAIREPSGEVTGVIFAGDL